MIMERQYMVDVQNVDASNFISNRGILNLFENIACLHSDIAGYGMNQIEKTHLTWILLNWKVRILKRVMYGSKVTVKTWARTSSTFFTLRDFEMYDENNELVCIASSKWTLVDATNGRILRITPEIIETYSPEPEKSVFGEDDIAKLKEPEELRNSENAITPVYIFTAQRRDIDINKHMHNIYYLDYAMEALPQEVYDDLNYNEFEIMYKSGIKFGDKVNCFYSKQDDVHFIVMKNADDDKLNAIIKFKI